MWGKKIRRVNHIFSSLDFSFMLLNKRTEITFFFVENNRLGNKLTQFTFRHAVLNALIQGN
jgi:hypothetical protein